MTVTTLRPTALVYNADSPYAWSPSTGTIVGVTSDDNDATYITGSAPAASATLRLTTGANTPPVGERRHRIRTRVRVSATFAGQPAAVRHRWSTDTQNGGWSIGDTDATSVGGQNGSWVGVTEPQQSGLLEIIWDGYDLNLDTFAGSRVKVHEIYVDVDTRAQPTSTTQALNGAGSPDNTITDTNTPTIRVSAYQTDGLTASDVTVAVYPLNVTLAPGFVPGQTAGAVRRVNQAAGPSQTLVSVPPLTDGDYVAYGRIRTRIGAGGHYDGVWDDYAFNVTTTPPNPPEGFQCDVDGMKVDLSGSVDADGVQWDDPSGLVVEVQRMSCHEDWRTVIVEGPVEPQPVREFTFEGGVDGDPVLQADSGNGDPFTSQTVSGWAFEYDTTAHAGSLSGLVTPNGTGRVVAGWNPVTADSAYARMYVRVGQLPSDHYDLIHVEGVGWVTINSSGLLTADTPTGSPEVGTVAITPNQWVRVEAGWNGVYLTARLFTGGNVDGTVPDDEIVALPGTFHSASGVQFGYRTDSTETGLQWWDGLAAGENWLGPDPLAVPPDWQTSDVTPPLSGDSCGTPVECDVSYRARWWGRVDGAVTSSEWAECGPVQVDGSGGWLVAADGQRVRVCLTEGWQRVRPFGRFQPVEGGIPTVYSGAPGGRDYTLDIATSSTAELVALEEVLSNVIVLYQPEDRALPQTWLAPQTVTVQNEPVAGVFSVQASFVAVDGRPLPDPQSLV